MTHSDLQTRFDAWTRTRIEYSKREETGPLPSSNEWQWSDDEAVELLHQAMSVLQSKIAVMKALDELIGTLTTHADAMRTLLQESWQLIEYENPPWSSNLLNRMMKAVDAYDAAIKEA